MRNVLIALAAVGALSACASRPEPTPTPDAPSQPSQPSQPSGPTPGSVEDFRVSVGDRVFFGYDRFDLTPEARQVLERQAAWLRQYPNVRLLVAGNADERGTREYNLALGARRAAAARDYLVSLGVPAARLETVSYGKERPLDPRSNEEAWSVNRNAHSNIVSGTTS
ncbi:peptidoglycan-associated lipoprotein Pal [Terricaulis silvestris]|uniref:Peptidoglycan-associated lipoprotein n=1 Tax=Terricaulis silvestris TaxID=2686094 RepID=A0A6I6MZ18_9CAUL|nr:peptidoglycan-associated lipoprotein Pal [Terricaulis silvestris]QGZ96383.1 Minor outer membrane protein Omp16 [Terricaulis silvestris]